MDRDIGAKFGKRLRELREARGMTQALLGEHVGKSVETISNIERGRTLPGLLTVTQFAAVLGVQSRDLFAFDDPLPVADAPDERISHRLSLLCEADRLLVYDFLDLLQRHRRRS